MGVTLLHSSQLCACVCCIAMSSYVVFFLGLLLVVGWSYPAATHLHQEQAEDLHLSPLSPRAHHFSFEWGLVCVCVCVSVSHCLCKWACVSPPPWELIDSLRSLGLLVHCTAGVYCTPVAVPRASCHPCCCAEPALCRHNSFPFGALAVSWCMESAPADLWCCIVVC